MRNGKFCCLFMAIWVNDQVKIEEAKERVVWVDSGKQLMVELLPLLKVDGLRFTAQAEELAVFGISVKEEAAIADSWVTVLQDILI